jgi:hypothetical protein
MFTWLIQRENHADVNTEIILVEYLQEIWEVSFQLFNTFYFRTFAVNSGPLSERMNHGNPL